ncbi:hypothetical protein VTI74DRAFT_481 [Chaetomium olivicolor]
MHKQMSARPLILWLLRAEPWSGLGDVYLAKSVRPRKEFKALGRVRRDAVLATRGLEYMAVNEAFTARDVDFAFDSWPLSEPMRRRGEETPIEARSPVNPNIPLPDDDEIFDRSVKH